LIWNYYRHRPALTHFWLGLDTRPWILIFQAVKFTPR
jgi:hypothetical protein